MAKVRDVIEREVLKLVQENVPVFWRSRALNYVPLVVDRITAVVETFQGGASDAND
jgi:hypothetical protein